MEAIASGMGIGALPIYAAVKGLKDGTLQQVLPNHSLYPLNVYALYPSRQYLDAKIRTLVDFLRDTLPGLLKADEQAVKRLYEEGPVSA